MIKTLQFHDTLWVSLYLIYNSPPKRTSPYFPPSPLIYTSDIFRPSIILTKFSLAFFFSRCLPFSFRVKIYARCQYAKSPWLRIYEALRTNGSGVCTFTRQFEPARGSLNFHHETSCSYKGQIIYIYVQYDIHLFLWHQIQWQ